MIQKINAYDDSLPWGSHAYYVATRYKELSLISQQMGTKVFYVELAAGGRILPHSQKEAQLLFCIEGTGTFWLNDAETTLRAGDMLYVPAEAVQGAVNEGEGRLRLLVSRAPEEGGLEMRDLLRRWWAGKQ